MKTILTVILVLFTLGARAQYYTAPEMSYPDLNGGNSAMFIIHNHTENELQLFLSGWQVWGHVKANSVTEFWVPNGMSAQLYYDTTGYSENLRSNFGSQVDTSKPYVKHIHVYVNGTNVTYFALPAVNLANPWKHFELGIALGLAIAVGVATIRKIRAAFRVSSE